MVFLFLLERREQILVVILVSLNIANDLSFREESNVSRRRLSRLRVVGKMSLEDLLYVLLIFLTHEGVLGIRLPIGIDGVVRYTLEAWDRFGGSGFRVERRKYSLVNITGVLLIGLVGLLVEGVDKGEKREFDVVDDSAVIVNGL